MIRSKISMMILLCCFFLCVALPGYSLNHTAAKKVTTAKAAPTVKAKRKSNPYAYKPPNRQCTRATLKAAAASYIAAQETGDLSKMSLAPGAKFMENMSKTTKDKGLWNTPLPIAHKMSIYDVGRCKTFSEVIVTKGGHPYVIGTRLTVNKGKITKINSLVTDKGDWLFNAKNYLKYSKAEDWSILPVDDRIGRQALVDAANQYFDFVFKDKSIRPRWGGVPCARLEGGAYTNPKNEQKDTCRIPAPLANLYIVDRTFVVDAEMGAVNVFCRFGNSNGMPDSHTFRLINGKYRDIHTLSVNLTDKPVVIPKFKPEPNRQCTRATLRAAAASYIAAQETGDLSKMSLAPGAKFMENMSKTTKDKGLWNTPLPIAHKMSIYDVGRCKTFSEVIVTKGGHPYVIGTRLTVNKGKITKINSLVTDKGDWLFNAKNYLKYSKAEDWSILPVDDRIGRQALVDAANQYFDFVFMDKSIRPRWGGVPCARLEGGAYTNPKNEQKDTCRVPAPLGELPIVDRSFVVDAEMGTVNVFCRFGNGNGMPDSHTFRLINGKYRDIHTLTVNLSNKPLAKPKNMPGEKGN